MKLLSVSADTKTVKGEKAGYLTGILYLAPAKVSGYETCAKRTKGCTEACLYTAGRGAFSTVQQSRINKTQFYFENREAFMDQLVTEIGALIRKAYRMGLIPVVRLNGTSDIPWERIPVAGFDNIMSVFPSIQFYDYTKRTNRRRLPDNYHLTFSRADGNEEDTVQVIGTSTNVAVVFSGGLPTSYYGRPVINGDETDLRFLDPAQVVVGLKAKGKARGDQSGFVVQVAA